MQQLAFDPTYLMFVQSPLFNSILKIIGPGTHSDMVRFFVLFVYSFLERTLLKNISPAQVLHEW